MAIEHEVEALALRASERPSVRDQVARLMANERVRVAHYRKVFLTEAGTLTPSARFVLTDLANKAQLGRANPAATADELRAREAQRALVLHLLASFDLDEAKFRRMARQLRENDSE